MAFVSSIIVVKDVLCSRQLYENILHLKVIGDFGIYNVGFEGGLSLYRKAFFQELISGEVNLDRHNNVVLYFEVSNLEELEQEIAKNNFEFIHRIKEQPWQQRTFRCYGYDNNHILEITEKMDEETAVSQSIKPAHGCDENGRCWMARLLSALGGKQ